MAVFRRKGFPRRQEDPLIQQLLERARQEYAQSSAIGSPAMYKAAAGGGFGPVASVLAAQILGGVRSGTAQRQAQEIANRQKKALSTAADLSNLGYTDTSQGRVFVDNQGRLMRVADIPGQENKIGDVTSDVLKNAKYEITKNQMGQLDKFIEESQGPLNEIARIANQEQLPESIGQEDDISIIESDTTQSDIDPSIPRIPPIGLEPTTITEGEKPSMLSRVLTGAGDTTKTYRTAGDYITDAGYDPLEYDLSMKELSRKNIKTTFTKPEQKNVTTITKGKKSTEPATLRYKTTTDSFGNTEQIIEIRENGVFVGLGPNQKISSDLKENKLNEKNYVYQGIKPMTYIDKNDKEVVIKRGQRVIFDKNNPSDISLLKLINNNPSLFRIGSMYSTSNLQEAKPLALKSNLTKKVGYIGTKKDLTIDNRIEQIITLDIDLKDNNGQVIVNKGTYNSIDNPDDFKLIKSLAEATSVSERNLDKRTVLKDSGAMKKLGEDLQQKRNSLKGIYRLIAKIDNSDVGFNRFFDDFKSKYNTLLASGLEPKEIALRAARGETQGLIGALRLDVLGPGVVTEQDALRLLAFIGGQVGAFENVAVFREQIKGILDVAEQNFSEDYDLYNKLKTENPERYKYTIDIQDVTKDFQKRPFFDDTTIPDLSSGAIKNAKPGSVIWNRLSKLIEDNPNTYQNMMTPLQLEALEEMLQ